MLPLTPRLNHAIPPQLAHLPPVLARLVAARGVQDEQALATQLAALLPANQLKGLMPACQLLDMAIDQRQVILIVGDFDVDGATSTALMVRVLTAMGATVNYLVPDRFKYGYGLTPEIVALGVELYAPQVIVTVDNGISSHAGVQSANQAGVQVIITDHHLTTKDNPPAAAVVNPNQLNCNFASKALAGVGVAFYVLATLAKLRRQAGKPSTQVTQYLDLVALGTVADVAILDKNNRILVAQGLNQIRQGQCSLGILALLKQAGREPSEITSQDFGFILGPRINAAGRLDNMAIGIECLLADDWQTAQDYAQQLENLNRERRLVESDMRVAAQQALETIHIDSLPAALVLYQPDWHQGVIGIVAGRLKEQFYRPTIVFAAEHTDSAAVQGISHDKNVSALLKGSARSIDGIHIRDAIEQVAHENPDLVSHFGGHAMAAGLSIYADKLEQFTQAFIQVIKRFDDSLFCPSHFTDGELTVDHLTVSFARQLKHSFIWGNGFAPPRFDGVFNVDKAYVLKEKHLKLRLSQQGLPFSLDAIWFNYNKADWQENAMQVHVLYELTDNTYQGQTKVQLLVNQLAVVI